MAKRIRLLRDPSPEKTCHLARPVARADYRDAGDVAETSKQFLGIAEGEQLSHDLQQHTA
jgi:hypothetical protein